MSEKRDSILGAEDKMMKAFRFIKLTLGGAVFTVAAVGTVATALGFDMTTQVDLVAAAIGGGATSVALIKIAALA
ncbi:MAG: hypothetical protein AAFR39_04240 [Pseudomonadota bacterium]